MKGTMFIKPALLLVFIGALPLALPAQETRVRINIAYDGVLKPYKRLTALSEVAGKVEKINFMEGQTVKKGEILGFLGNVVCSLAVEVVGNEKSIDKLSTQKQIVAMLK